MHVLTNDEAFRSNSQRAAERRGAPRPRRRRRRTAAENGFEADGNGATPEDNEGESEEPKLDRRRCPGLSHRSHRLVNTGVRALPQLQLGH